MVFHSLTELKLSTQPCNEKTESSRNTLHPIANFARNLIDPHQLINQETRIVNPNIILLISLSERACTAWQLVQQHQECTKLFQRLPSEKHPFQSSLLKKSCTGFCEGLLETVSYPLYCSFHCYKSLDNTSSFTAPRVFLSSLSAPAENVWKGSFVEHKTVCAVKAKNPWNCSRKLNADF